ncbi:CDP-glycerol glycerophosphotransferase [Psittacicella gerlachiana]|uniref:CDP-glycerol:poly(Glycerophosphate) glycerophosphotransferase n=1 Tax=Psittacicella gerlachiana TaxID=2028574 RepID=A0A3A1YM06_9GAMM|nr:CDP-glycerol glycerophosphotransferase [Psittacicella gerlachiana]RIY38496.1 hypothetical protein CKF59_00740 [Psittacicella gerlachiana]
MLYLYLDTKIVGAAKQIVSYFEQGIFSSSVEVLVKRYKHKSSERIAKVFTKGKVKFRFVTYADLDSLTQGVIFYPFNAQSNCRAVANRNLLHVFITHGESNKVASIKPIIRIYDYVITAGQAGIDRFLQAKIFTPADVEAQRILTFGDTFVGRTGLKEQAVEAVCFYAPTWEGGIESENYTSLAYPQVVATNLLAACRLYQVKKIVLKPHPNSGQRKKKILTDFLYYFAPLAQDQGIALEVYARSLTFSWWQLWRLGRYGVKFIHDLSCYQARIGFCDLSAMETQFLNEEIPHYLFFKAQNLASLPPEIDVQLYQQHLIFLEQNKELAKLGERELAYLKQLKNYLIAPDLAEIPLSQRVEYLLVKLQHLKS